MLRVRLAGGLRLELDGRELAPPRSRRARGLLAWLALHPGPRARGDLAGRFWPDVIEESARSSLRTALTELRHALQDGAAHVVATRETVTLDDRAWVDVREFERLRATGRLAEAVDTCAGELLTGMDEDWVHEARRDHQLALGAVLEKLAARAQEEGDLATAVRHSREAYALDPLAEDAGRALMARLAHAGDRAAALALYDRLSERLRSDLRVAPSAATRELAEEIRRGDSRVIAPPPLPAVGTPFAGRTEELRRLRAIWHRLVEQRARRLVVVAGEPGVGKTRLALELAAGLDGVVLLGRCSEEPLGAYEPFAQMLRRLAAGDPRAFGGELDRLLASAEPAPDAGARHRLFVAIDAVLTAGERPRLLIIDDLQWADRGTLALLTALMHMPPAPLLILATVRSTEPAPRLVGAERLDLRGLTRSDIAQLAGDDRLAAAIHERTDGNAYFVEEILRSGADTVPDSVRQMIDARRAAVSEPARTLLEFAAVAGLEFEAGLLADDAEAALDELLAAHLLRTAGARVAFPHALVREHVESGMNPLRRLRLHRAAAEAYIARSADQDLEAIAHHLHAAGDVRAVEYLRRAGERAITMLAYEEAASHLARALELAPDDGTLQLALGDALMRAGKADQARRSFAATAKLARRNEDPELLARAALAGLGVAVMAVDEQRRALLEEALAAVGDRDPLLSSELLARLAIELYYTPARDRSEQLSAEAVQRAEGNPRAVAAALNARHVALWRPDRLHERITTADEMLAAACAADDRQLELQARNWRVVDRFELGDLDAWRTEVRRHGELAAELKLPLYEWYTPLWAAVDALHAGRYDTAAELREQARDAGGRAGDPNSRLFAQLLEIHGAWLRADWAAVDMDLLREKVANSPAGSAYRCGFTWCLAELGEHKQARAHLDEIARNRYATLPFDTNWLSAAGECAEACVILGAAEHAAPLYELLAPYSGRPLTAGRALLHYGAADRHLGGLARLLGRENTARAHYERAIAQDTAAGLHPWVERSIRQARLADRDQGRS
ncbi:ATP-binding protein [Solirubrobacter soli]|uniref:ATP-binding protein n=1 Tax=Solirubrobacter soli TaxID=363832 RepID=UPI00041D43CA|nr:AAA family ATPase [Solirubrobacter soli]